MNFDKKNINLITIILILLLPCFTFCIFGPLELYLTNINDFWFSIEQLIPVLLFVFLTTILLCFFILIGVNDKLRLRIMSFLFAIGFAFYLQGNYLPSNYGVLDGKPIDWSNYLTRAIINTCIWIICFLVSFLLLKKNSTRAIKLFKTASLLIVLVQITTLQVLLFSTNLEKENITITDEGINNVSSNKNIVMFVLDSFDNIYLQEIIKEDASYLQPLEGFTYFRNNVGSYSTTKGALPFILTGQYYLNENTYSDYLVEAYKDSSFYTDLQNNNYDTRIYSSSTFIPGTQNYLINNISLTKPAISSYKDFGALMYKFVSFRYMPHVVKSNFWLYSGEFNGLVKTDNDSYGSYVLDDYSFFHKLANEKLQIIDSDKNAFRLYHLAGVHYPYILNEKMEQVEAYSITAIQQAKASLNIVYEYIKQMQDLNIYKDSLILIIADHGVPSATGFPSNPIMLVKPSGQDTGYSISDAPVSHANLHATIMEEVVSDYEKYGESVFDVNEGALVNRKYYSYNWDDSWDSDYLPDISEYTVLGDANVESSFNLVNKLYTSKGILAEPVNTYTLGEVLYFDESEKTASKYFRNGISLIQEKSAWSLGSKSDLAIEFTSIPQNDIELKLSIKNIMQGNQRIFIECDGEIINETEVVGNNSILKLRFPKNLLKANKLYFSILYPDAVSPATLGINDDSRNLAVEYESFSIEEVKTYSIGEKLFFKEGSSVFDYFSSGLSTAENDFAWTFGDEGELNIDFENEPQSDIKLSINIKFIFINSQRLVAKYGESVIFDKLLTNEDSVDIIISKDYILDKKLTLELQYPDAVSPKSLGINEDTRQLAFAFTSISFNEVQN